MSSAAHAARGEQGRIAACPLRETRLVVIQFPAPQRAARRPDPVTHRLCAFPPATERDKRDPLERFNRAVFKLNRGVDRAVARPAAKVYVAVTPKPVRAGVSNFMQNIGYPVTIANDLLQGKPLQMTRDLGRLLVNTTLGVGGLFDPATKMGLVANDEDFGQTLGKWGLHPGPYLMLPLLGPATIRDTFGRAGDVAITPRSYVKDDTTRYAVLALDLVDTRAQLLDADATLDSSFDPYGFVRDAYLQRREFSRPTGTSRRSTTSRTRKASSRPRQHRCRTRKPSRRRGLRRSSNGQ